MLTTFRPALLTRRTVLPPNRALRCGRLINSNPSRSFHASPVARWSLDQNLLLVHDALQTIHSATGLPWAFTIPLVSVLVRSAIVTPLMVYQHIAIQKRRKVSPLLLAWSQALKMNAQREGQEDAPQMATKLAKRLYKQDLYRTKKVLFRRWGAQAWKTQVPLLQLPIWLHIIECIRRMCGFKESWLWLLGTGFRDKSVTGSSGVESASEIASTPLIPVDSSLATEGALWFPNLLVPDPTWALSFTLMGSFYLAMYVQSRLSPMSTAAIPVWRSRLGRGFKYALVLIVPLTLNTPAAVMIYMITASLFSTVQNMVIRWLLPFEPPPVPPCKPKSNRVMQPV